MITELLRPEIISFIEEHEHDDVRELLLKHDHIYGVPIQFVADQIKGRQKAKNKLPEFYQAKNIIYPKPVNLEQASSEATAKIKSDFVYGIFNKKGGKAADLTGGFGTDSYYLSNVFIELHFAEINDELLKIAEHNFRMLSATNVVFHPSEAGEFLSSSRDHFDLVYIDPSRRNPSNRKVFKLSECHPDIVRLQPEIFAKTEKILIKTSPLSDLREGLEKIRNVRRILVISIDNECKEVVFYCEKGFTGEPEIEAVNKGKSDSDEFIFTLSEERSAQIKFSHTLNFLYEPNASILKAGAFRTIAKRFDLLKLHPNTHLYTSQDPVGSFPGKVFRIISPVKPDPKTVSSFLPGGKANITTRNYPLTPEQLKKNLKLSDGGDQFLIGCTDMNGKKLFLAERLK